jgi:hypothetical protein
MAEGEAAQAAGDSPGSAALSAEQVQKLAELVYELFRRDLAQMRERAGRSTFRWS